MTCYRNPASPHEQRFNRILKTDRSIIERAFGELKQRFPMLYQKIRIETERIPKFITACFILHKIAIFLKDLEPFDEELQHDDEIENNENEYDNLPGNSELLRRGKFTRNAIALMIQNEQLND